MSLCRDCCQADHCRRVLRLNRARAVVNPFRLGDPVQANECATQTDQRVGEAWVLFDGLGVRGDSVGQTVHVDKKVAQIAPDVRLGRVRRDRLSQALLCLGELALRLQSDAEKLKHVGMRRPLFEEFAIAGFRVGVPA